MRIVTYEGERERVTSADNSWRVSDGVQKYSVYKGYNLIRVTSMEGGTTRGTTALVMVRDEACLRRGHNDQSRRGHQCSETTLTGESRFHISTVAKNKHDRSAKETIF